MPIIWIFAQMMAIQQREYVQRVNGGGNFCGHSPDSPQLSLAKPTTSKRRPKILGVLQDRIKAYYHSPKVLPSLNGANGSKRQQRSERREACLQLLTAIVEFTDLASLRCGVPTKEGFLSLTLDYLIQYTGLGVRRAERAMADLKAANLLTVSQPRQLQPDGSWRGMAAVKAVNKLLFAAFGLGHRLRYERERASDRLRIKELHGRRGTTTGWARTALILSKMRSMKPVALAGWEPRQIPQPVEYHRMKVDLQVAITLNNPGITTEELNKEVNRLLENVGR